MKTLNVRYAYKRGKVEQNTLDGRMIEQEVPVGEAHLFKVERNRKGKEDVAVRSMCGKGMTDVAGKNGFVRRELVPNLPVCPKCQTAWKNDPASPWRRWVKMLEVVE